MISQVVGSLASGDHSIRCIAIDLVISSYGKYKANVRETCFPLTIDKMLPKSLQRNLSDKNIPDGRDAAAKVNVDDGFIELLHQVRSSNKLFADLGLGMLVRKL